MALVGESQERTPSSEETTALIDEARDSAGDDPAARRLTAGNPIANAIVERAGALLDDDHKRLLSTADAFDTVGRRYQWARTMMLAGGDHTARGAAALAELGLAPMAAP